MLYMHYSWTNRLAPAAYNAEAELLFWDFAARCFLVGGSCSGCLLRHMQQLYRTGVPLFSVPRRDVSSQVVTTDATIVIQGPVGYSFEGALPQGTRGPSILDTLASPSVGDESLARVEPGWSNRVCSAYSLSIVGV